MADSVPRESQRAIGRVLTPWNRMLAQIPHNFGSADRQHRTDESHAAFPVEESGHRHPRQPARPSASKEVHEHGFGLISGVMGRNQGGALRALGHYGESFITQLPGGGFEPQAVRPGIGPNLYVGLTKGNVPAASLSFHK